MSEVRPRPRPPDRSADPNAPIPYRASEGLQTTTSKGQGGAPAHFVRSRRGEMVQLGEEEFLLFTLIDGQPSFADIQREFKARFAGDLSRRHFQAFIDELLAAGIIERIAAESQAGLASTEVAAPVPEMAAPEPAAAAVQPGAAADIADTAPPGRAGPGFSLRPAFVLLARLGAPLRFFLWVLVPAVLAAGIMLYGTAFLLAARLGSIDWESVLAPVHDASIQVAAASRLADWTGVRRLVAEEAGRLALLPHGGIVGSGLAALAACWLIPRIAQGAVAAYHGAPRQVFRLRISAWVIPRFPVDRALLGTLSRKGRVCCHAAPLLALLALLVAGAALSGIHDPRDSRVALGGLLLAWVSGGLFLAGATPVWPSHGRRWMACYLGAASAPDAPPGRGRGFLIAAGLITLAAGVGALLCMIAPSGVPGRLAWPPRQIAAWLLGGAYAAGLIWLFSARVVAEPLRDATGVATARTGVGGMGMRDAAFFGAMSGAPPSLDDRLFGGGEAWPSNRRAVIYAIMFAILVCIAFLPYPYESGGGFIVLPNDHFALLARVSGEITEVLVREGEWVQEGQVVATLADWVEVHNLATSQAQLEQSMANLQNLLISPKPEEVEVARKQYEQAASRLPYSRGDYERKLALVKTSDIPVSQFELSQSTYEQDQAAVAVTKANYDFVRVGPTQAQIAAARAGVHLATELVAYNRDQLDRTRIRATTSGQVVTPDPQLMMGQFLAEGAVFIALEDHRVAHVEVQVPENDIRDIHLGSLVRAKAWGYEHTIWLGKTILIAPDAQPNVLVGNVVRVVAEIPNEGGLLRPTMSGDAKVETVDMPVWVSFTRALMRFLLIEVWYWIP